MDKPISVGDLVVIVKPRICGCMEPLGHIHLVKKIIMSRESGVKCIYCGDVQPQTLLADFGEVGTQLYRLKRIPPLNELEGLKSEEKLWEPA